MQRTTSVSRDPALDELALLRKRNDWSYQVLAHTIKLTLRAHGLAGAIAPSTLYSVLECGQTPNPRTLGKIKDFLELVAGGGNKPGVTGRRRVTQKSASGNKRLSQQGHPL